MNYKHLKAVLQVFFDEETDPGYMVRAVRLALGDEAVELLPKEWLDEEFIERGHI